MQKFKKYLQHFLYIFTYNLKTIISFELLFKALLSVIFIPIALWCFNQSMKLAGFSYLTAENLLKYIESPVTIVFACIIAIYLAIVTWIEVSTVILILDASNNHERITLREAARYTIDQSKGLITPKNLPAVILLLIIIPFINIGIGSNVISSIKLPDCVMEIIENNAIYSVIYVLIYLVLLIHFIRWMFSIHYMVIEGKNFKDARRSSKNLIKGTAVKDFISVIVIEALVAGIVEASIIAGAAMFSLFARNAYRTVFLPNYFLTVAMIIIGIILIFFSSISTALGYGILSTLFYEHKKEKNEEVFKIDYGKCRLEVNKATNKVSSIKEFFKNIAQKFHKTTPKFVLIASVLVFLSTSLFVDMYFKGKVNLNVQDFKTTEITAHRGASSIYPENTMSAFKGAQELNADWIELDVQQTKDRQIIVSHDSNLKRVTGVDKDIIELNYGEISKLDAGSFFNPKFSDARIPLLSDVLEFAKQNNAKLNIELKPTGKEVDFEEQVIELIKKYDYVERCVVTSQVYEVIEKVKELDANITTVYVTGFAVGKISQMQAADAYSVEISNVNSQLVEEIHNSGKQIYVWTVNSKDDMDDMIALNVDNIITDNITLGKSCVEASKTDNLFSDFVNFFIQ